VGKKRINNYSSRLVKTTMDSTAVARMQGKHVILRTNSSTQVNILYLKKKGKGLPQQAEVAQGVLGRLRPRIFLTFGTMRVVGRQP
jgi:hypothetical protein